MKLPAVVALVALAALPGCPGDDGNPSRLWFAPDGSETRLKLQDKEPPPW